MTKKEMEEVIEKLVLVVEHLNDRVDCLACNCDDSDEPRNEAYEVAKPVIDLIVTIVEGLEEEDFSREEAVEFAKILLSKGMRTEWDTKRE